MSRQDPTTSRQDPTTFFLQEHEETLRRLDSMEQVAEAIREEGITTQRLDTVRAVLEWLDSPTVRRHNMREENFLFAALEEAIPGESPTLMLREEHERLWDKLNLVQRWIERAEDEPESPEVAEGLGRAAGLMSRLMHHHIAKENDVLLPLTRHILGEVRLRSLMGDLAKV